MWPCCLKFIVNSKLSLLYGSVRLMLFNPQLAYITAQLPYIFYCGNITTFSMAVALELPLWVLFLSFFLTKGNRESSRKERGMRDGWESVYQVSRSAGRINACLPLRYRAIDRKIPAGESKTQPDSPNPANQTA